MCFANVPFKFIALTFLFIARARPAYSLLFIALIIKFLLGTIIFRFHTILRL